MTKDVSQKVETYIETKTAEFSKPICIKLREIFLSEGLQEEFKWGAPCYSHHGLLCNIGAFKKHVGTWFFKGSLLSDPKQVLIQAQDNTKALRSVQYKALADIDEKVLRAFIKEAMLLNEKGIKIDFKKDRVLEVPGYFIQELEKNKKAQETFDNFSYSRKKEYVDWVTEAKREATRQKRISQSIEMLAEGKGRHDKYR